MSGRAFITGVSGFAGKHLARQLLADGWEVAGTVRSRTSGISAVREYRLELDDLDAVSRAISDYQPEDVYHLAAVVDTVVTPDVMALFRSNIMGTAATLEAVARIPAVERVLVASSALAYGRPKHDTGIASESDPLEPLTPYGASKAATEALALQWARQHSVNVIVARAFQQTGPEHVGGYALSVWASQLANGATVLKVGDLEVWRDYLDVRDVASAYRALISQGRSGEAYNVGSGRPVRMCELLEGLIDAFGGTATIEVDPARLRAVDTPKFVADITKLASDTSWHPRFTLTETLADLASWWMPRTT